jgi:alkylated DNA repair dioxygenase AlkB
MNDSRQLALFADEVSIVARDYLGVSGLTYAASVLSAAEQSATLHAIDQQPWLNDLKRRVQHYGYKYDYRSRRIDPSMFVGPLPAFGLDVANKLLSLDLITRVPDQLIVNEYLPGQGITAHVDCEPCFADTIVTVSLGSVCEMDLIELESRIVRSALLDLGSALVLSGEARYGWQHRIMARKSDHGVPRNRRVSLTFRNVILCPPM